MFVDLRLIIFCSAISFVCSQYAYPGYNPNDPATLNNNYLDDSNGQIRRTPFSGIPMATQTVAMPPYVPTPYASQYFPMVPPQPYMPAVYPQNNVWPPWPMPPIPPNGPITLIPDPYNSYVSMNRDALSPNSDSLSILLNLLAGQQSRSAWLQPPQNQLDPAILAILMRYLQESRSSINGFHPINMGYDQNSVLQALLGLILGQGNRGALDLSPPKSPTFYITPDGRLLFNNQGSGRLDPALLAALQAWISEQRGTGQQSLMDALRQAVNQMRGRDSGSIINPGDGDVKCKEYCRMRRKSGGTCSPYDPVAGATPPAAVTSVCPFGKMCACGAGQSLRKK